MSDEHERSKADADAKQRVEATKKHADDTRKKLADARTAREKASKERAKSVSEIKPTPTQEECDLAAEGVYLAEHEDDGSGPEPGAPEDKSAETKQIEGKPAPARGTYATRSSNPV